MHPLQPENNDKLAEQLSGKSDKIAALLNEVLEQEFSSTVQERRTIALGEYSGEGIVFLFILESMAAFGVLRGKMPFPDWARSHSEEEEDRRNDWANRLGDLLFDGLATATAVRFIPELDEFVARAELGDTLSNLTFEMGEDESLTLSVLWPADNPIALLDALQPESPETAPQLEPPPAPVPEVEGQDFETGVESLPAYSRSLLKIPVPISVVLAQTKLSVRRIVELGPGSIIQFRKSCDDTLTLQVGDQEIAEGEAVKVGDKFGLWLTSMTLPGERFWALKEGNQVRRVK